MSGRRGGQRVPPDDPVIVDVHRLESDLQLIPFFQIVASHNIGDLHLAAGFLHIQIRARIFAGGGRGADGQGARITQRGCNFIGQSQAEKIDVFVGTGVLEGQDGDGGRVSLDSPARSGDV